MQESSQADRRLIVDHSLLNYKAQLARSILLAPTQQRQALLSKWPHDSIQHHAKQIQQIETHEPTNELYFGEKQNHFRHGFALLLRSSEPLRFYEGHFQNNCKHGYGLEFIAGDCYMGQFVNGQPEDQSGLFMWANGDTYHGTFINGMKHGYGSWVSGSNTYEGYWQFNKPNGKALIKNGDSQYSGEVKNGVKYGQGCELFQNGDRYKGNYVNGSPEGKGVYSWRNGATYQGQFKNGMRYGFGKWFYGGEKYEGYYINDKRNGEGTYVWQDQSKYKGGFVNDLRQGEGEMQWSDGSIYKGSWLEGFQHGQGSIWKDDNLLEKGTYERGECIIKKYPQAEQTKRYSKNPSISSHNSGENYEFKRSNVKQEKSLIEQRSMKIRLLSKSQRHQESPEVFPVTSRNYPKGLGDINVKRADLNLLKKRQLSSRAAKVEPIKLAHVQPLRKKVELRAPVRINPEQLLNQAIATQLTPIKWKNFRQFGSYS